MRRFDLETKLCLKQNVLKTKSITGGNTNRKEGFLSSKISFVYTGSKADILIGLKTLRTFKLNWRGHRFIQYIFTNFINEMTRQVLLFMNHVKRYLQNLQSTQRRTQIQVKSEWTASSNKAQWTDTVQQNKQWTPTHLVWCFVLKFLNL